MIMNTDSSGANVICDSNHINFKPSQCPNPLFEKWLEEWRMEAEMKNSDLQYCYGKALKSLRRYPLKLNCGQECLILNNFGTQLAKKLDRKLEEYSRSHPMTDIASDFGSSNSESDASINSGSRTSEIATSNKRKKKDVQPYSLAVNGVDDSCLLNGGITKNGINDEIASSRRKTKPYVPEVRSGAYAILIVMLKKQENSSYPGFMLKRDIVDKAQDICDHSFTRPNPGTRYTAWNSMSTLIKKVLVIKSGCPARYALTDTGKELAKKLQSESDFGNEAFKSSSSSPSRSSNFSLGSVSCTKFQNVSTEHCNSITHRIPPCKSPISGSFYSLSEESYEKNLNSFYNNCEDFSSGIQDICIIDDMPESKPSTSKICLQRENSPDNEYQNFISSSDADEQLIFLPEDYQIILLVDTQETIGRVNNQIIQETTQELTALKVNFEVRRLKVGDFVWVARNKENRELVLPYIIERKRMDDLGKSIKNKRFNEQKFRLRQCGLPNVIYLIEKYGHESRLGLPINTLNQAIINTQVDDNFFVKTTNNHKHAMSYLSVLTNLLKDIFRDKTLISCPRNELPEFDSNAELLSFQTFQEFSKFSAKNKDMKIQDVFSKHLLQLKGLSVEKASVITQNYPTPQLLKDAFKSSSKPETLLTNLTFGELKRNIGPTISRTIHELYTNKILL